MKRLLFTLFALLTPMLAVAHGDHDHDHDDEHPVAEAQFPAAMVLPDVDGPKPWSDKPLFNHPDRFQIAIMTDRTGGHRPGVWMDAVRKLNLLRPEFVVSVGDLIEGYTEDRAQVQREWAEFLGFIEQLQMRFFFVAGNHDLTNPMMHEMWRERFGPEWYSFDYRGVHFVCLCSEDPREHLGEEQIAWVKQDLEANRDARWTLVFLHKPLWTYAERGIERDGEDPTNWKRVEAMLVDRPHTVFAGHVHHYVQYERNDREYYSLATTGGGSSLRGDQYGEFDHVTWLTMEQDGPHVVNLRLDGILPADVVTEKSAERLFSFLRNATIEVAPILVDDEYGFDEGQLEVRLINEFGENVEIEGSIDGLPMRGLTADPDSIKLSVGPAGTATQSVRLGFSEPIEFAGLRRATFTAKVRTTQPGPNGEPPLEVERSAPVIIDRRYDCPLLANGQAIDGVFDPAPARWYSTPSAPLVLGDVGGWKGADDGSFDLAVAHDEERLVFSVVVRDERVIAGEDSLRLILDGRSATRRADDARLRWGSARIRVSAPTEDGPVEATAQIGRGWRASKLDLDASARRTEDGWRVEFALPTDRMDEAQNDNWSDFQLSAILEDVDDPGAEPARVVWRGSREVDRRNTNFAQFVRGE